MDTELARLLASIPADVLDEVVYLVEKVIVLEGTFDERFLQLPERVVVTGDLKLDADEFLMLAEQSRRRSLPGKKALARLGGNPEAIEIAEREIHAMRRRVAKLEAEVATASHALPASWSSGFGGGG